jgi:hypothetical protein
MKAQYPLLLFVSIILGCGDRGSEGPDKSGGGEVVTRSVSRSSTALGKYIGGQRIYFSGGEKEKHYGWIQFNTDGTAMADGLQGVELKYIVSELTVNITAEDSVSVVMAVQKPKIGKGDQLVINENGESSVVTVERVEVAKNKPSLAFMMEYAGAPLAEEEIPFVGRWVETDPEDPKYRSEIIWRVDHTYTVMFVTPAVGEDGKEIPGEFDRDLTHGVWRVAGNHINFADLIVYGNTRLPNDQLQVNEAIVLKTGQDGYEFVQYNDGVKFKTRGMPKKAFENPEMKGFNDGESLKKFDIHKALKQAKEQAPEE